MKKIKFSDGSWENLVSDWSEQLKATNNDFEEYFENSASFQLLETECEKLENIAIAGVFALIDDQNTHTAICYASGGMTNKIPGQFMRVRHFLLSPRFDSQDVSFESYLIQSSKAIKALIDLAKNVIKCPEIKIHFKSRSELEPMKKIMQKLKEEKEINSLSTHNLWLIIKH